MKSDVLSILEAAYRVEEPEAAWLRGILEASRGSLDAGRGVYAYLFDASKPSAFRAWSMTLANAPRGVTADRLIEVLASTPAAYVAQSFAIRSCGLASEIPGFAEVPSVSGFFRPNGIEDMLAVCGIDPTGQGCYLGAALPARGKLGARERVMWERVAAHLAASFRLRRKLRSVEATLSPSGKVEDAVGDAAKESARRSLQEAVVRIDRARGKLRGTSVGEAVAEWRGLVAARWSLLEHFERDGRRYFVARRNDPDAPGTDALTRRERQVLGWAALGHSNKLIAYELGISTSTVGVLLSRATRKLGARTRAGAITAWRASLSG